jgi:prepilin-type N-terminal cleavage/methylation domain-containing protein
MEGKNKGFTLVEIMVVMAIIAVLSVLIIGGITLTRKTAIETRHRANAKIVQMILERYASLNKNKYPTTCPRHPSLCPSATQCTCDFEDVEHDFGTGGLIGTGSGTLTPAPECQTTAPYTGNDMTLDIPGWGGPRTFDSSGGGLVEIKNSGNGYIIHIGDYQCLDELEHWDSL